MLCLLKQRLCGFTCLPPCLGGVLSTYMTLFFVMLISQCVIADVFVLDRRMNHSVADFESQVAFFGAPLTPEGFGGFLRVSQPLNACTPILPPPNDRANSTNSSTTTTLPWIVLVARGGNCHFAVKALSAQRAGYSAVIIYNDRSDGVFPMGGEFRVSIPAVMVGYSSGLELKRFVSTVSDHRYLVKLTHSLSPAVTDYLIPFVGVCVLSLAIFACYLVSQSISRCFSHYRHVRRSRLPIRALRAIPVVKFDPAGHTFDTCAICLEDFKLNDEIRVLPCNHAYHSVCIDPWLTRGRRVCPICKRGVLEDEYSSASSDDSSAGGGGNERRPLLSGRESQRGREGGGGGENYGSADAERTGNTEDNTSPSGSRRFQFWRRLVRSGASGIVSNPSEGRTDAAQGTSRTARASTGRVGTASASADGVSAAVHQHRHSRRLEGQRQRSVSRPLSASASADITGARTRRHRRQRQRAARVEPGTPPSAPQPHQQQAGADVVVDVPADTSDTTPLIV